MNSTQLSSVWSAFCILIVVQQKASNVINFIYVAGKGKCQALVIVSTRIMTLVPRSVFQCTVLSLLISMAYTLRESREKVICQIYSESFQGMGNTLYGDFVVGTKLWSHLDPSVGIRNGRISQLSVSESKQCLN